MKISLPPLEEITTFFGTASGMAVILGFFNEHISLPVGLFICISTGLFFQIRENKRKKETTDG